MAAEDRHAIVKDLLSLPFPQEARQLEGFSSSGPGHHVRVLQASQDFWDDRSEETVDAAEQEIDVTYRELVATLTAHWGDPEAVDLEPYLSGELPAAEPMGLLCLLSGEMLVWRRPETGRWVALAVGQADREFPVELLAAVGDAPLP
ncbi:hypothetical protein [Streptosporangium carneum]|uniref:Uncharacterized protein n=1 Tax=Streptosporangium carneum TaxID=47481 RepID=A0A9W6HZV7_9ACTN|nr:hypothetical protein [Streptosporangium carneum]GLK08856.1 hypothetical protein GCM10017600_22610 [Streptosporangium carneum]